LPPAPAQKSTTISPRLAPAGSPAVASPRPAPRCCRRGRPDASAGRAWPSGAGPAANTAGAATMPSAASRAMTPSRSALSEFTRRSSGAGVFRARARASSSSAVIRGANRSTSQSGKSSCSASVSSGSGWRRMFASHSASPGSKAPSSWRCDMPRTRDKDSSTSSRGEMRRASGLNLRRPRSPPPSRRRGWGRGGTAPRALPPARGRPVRGSARRRPAVRAVASCATPHRRFRR
jgi:hypothetical protein